MLTTGRYAACAALAAALAAPARAQCVFDELRSDRTGAGDLFGSAVAISDGWALVGSPGRKAEDGGRDGGAGAFFRLEGTRWRERAGACYSLREAARYGRAVAISEDRAATSGPGYSGGAGQICLYRLHDGTWYDDGTYDYPVKGHDLGASVAIDGDYLLAGSPGADQGGSVMALQSKMESWPIIGILRETKQQNFARFGSSVALSGEWAVVGAPGRIADDAGRDVGAAVLFELVDERWKDRGAVCVGRLSGDRMGFDVAIDGDRIAVSSPFADGGRGRVSILRRTESGWEPEAELGGPRAGEQFGFAVAIDGAGRVAVGAPAAADGDGAVYLFGEHGGIWSPVGELRTPGPGGGARLGASLDLSAGQIVAGAPTGSAAGERSGAAFVWLSPPASTGTFCEGTGTERLDAWGSGRSCEPLQLEVGSLPPGGYGVLLVSDGIERRATFPRGLCLGPRFHAFAHSFVSAGVDGRHSIVVETCAVSEERPQRVLPGDTCYFQVWYRNGRRQGAFTDGAWVAFR